MIALPDLPREFSAPPASYISPAPREIETEGLAPVIAGPLWRIGGLALLAAAAGIWVAPLVSGDALMPLMRLGASLGLVGLGIICLQTGRAPARAPLIEVDTTAGEIRVVTFGARGKVDRARRLKMADLAGVSLHEGYFQARDHDGKLVLSAEINDRRTEAQLTHALRL